MTRPEDYPLVEGDYQMTDQWSVFLPQPFRLRFEEKSLVLWRRGITAWIIVWNNDFGESPEERLERRAAGRSRGAFDEIRERGDDGVLRYAYRLAEESDDNRVAAFYSFAVGLSGHVQMAVYFDSESDLPIAEGLWRSLRERLDRA
jgi:hypothetical protein